MGRYIIAHDVGTSSNKAALVDFTGSIVATATAPYPIYYPYPAWVEQEPEDYWQAICQTSKKVIEKAGIQPNEVEGVIYSTQAMGIIPVDDEGKVLYRNISWVDGRAEKQAKKTMAKLGGPKVFKLIAGTEIMGKDVTAKILWIKEERPDIYRRTKYFLDVNGYLKMKSTGKMVAELSGASSYCLDLKKKEWMGAVSLLGIDKVKLPPLVKSTDNVGGLLEDAAKEMGLLPGTPVFGGCDDVQAATIGSGMNNDGDIHIYLGTSAWVTASTNNITKFKHGAAAIQSADPSKTLIAGITEAAGSNLEWLRENFFAKESQEMGEGKCYDFMDQQAGLVPPGSDHLIFTPWMLGERCPVSSTTTRSTIFNLDPSHTRNHYVRAMYEGIGYNLRWILENFKKDYKLSCHTFRVIGGGAMNSEWMQIIADITGVEFTTAKNTRSAGAVGSAIIALVGLGYLSGFKEASKIIKIEKTYRPNPRNAAIYNTLFKTYKDVYYSLEKPYKRANQERFTGEKDESDD